MPNLDQLQARSSLNRQWKCVCLSEQMCVYKNLGVGIYAYPKMDTHIHTHTCICAHLLRLWEVAGSPYSQD